MATWDINPGNNWATIINAHTGSTEIFLVKAGTHTGQTAPLRAGQKLLFEGGVTVNGNFAQASLFNGMTNNAHGAEVGGLDSDNPPDIHSYAPGFQTGVIKLRNKEVSTVRDAYIHDLTLRDSFSGASNEDGWAVDMGERTILRRCDISGMGQAGVAWSGKESAFQNPATAGGEIDDCDIHENGNPGNDAGGISKMSGGPGSRGRVLKNSRLWGNRRANVWCDFLGRDNSGGSDGQHGQWITSGVLEVFGCDLFEVGEGTLAEALFLEVSGGVFFHHNRVHTNQSNGGSGMDGAQVICHNAAYNIIEDNIIYDCGVNSFGIQQSARYDGSGRLVTCEGNAFRRNKVYVIDTGVNRITGLGQVGAGPPYQLLQGGGGGTWDAYTQGNNVWEDNQYFVLDTRHNQLGGDLFLISAHGGSMTFAEWQAVGYDVGGTYQVLPLSQLPSEVPELEGGTPEDFVRVSSGGRHGRSRTRTPRTLKGGRF